MSNERGVDLDDGIRSLLLLMPRLIGRAKRLPVPARLQGLELAPRHLSLLAYLLFDGPSTVNQLAKRLEVAPTTVSLLVGELSRKGMVERTEDSADRRRTIVTIVESERESVDAWLAGSARAWRRSLESLTPEQRAVVVDALTAYERYIDEELDER